MIALLASAAVALTGPNVQCATPDGQGLYLGNPKAAWENDGIIVDKVTVDLRNPNNPIVSYGGEPDGDIRLSGAVVKVRISDVEPKTFFVDAFYYNQGRSETYALVEDGSAGWLFLTSINQRSVNGKPSLGAYVAKCFPK